MNIVKNKLIDSVIKTALIIVLIYGFAFAMVQWGHQRLLKPPVLADSKYEFEISGKGGWNTWQSVELGTIELKSTDTVAMTIRSVDTFGARGIMNFCWIKLTPQ